MTTPTMPPEAAAWIRANVWTASMREIDGSYPDGRGCFLYRISPCEMQKCGACDMGRCDRCICREEDHDHRQWPKRWDTDVTLDGRVVAHLFAVDTQRCAGWVCTCDCRVSEQFDAGHAPDEDVSISPRPALKTSRPSPIPGQLDIFAEAT